MLDSSVLPSLPLVPFELLSRCWSSQGVSLNKFVWGFFKRNYLGPQKFLSPTQSLLVFESEVMGTYLPDTGPLGWVACCGAGTPCSRDITPEFLSTTCGCGTSMFHVSAPSTSLDGCGFFNLVVVRLPFNSISDGS